MTDTYDVSVDDGAIRVEEANPAYGDEPYTVQTGGCGERGRWTHLTPGYILAQNDRTLYGPPGAVFLSQWARLRWE